MPKKKYGLPPYLQNRPVGSEVWLQGFYKKDQQPKLKWIRLDAHDLAGAKIERERLLRAYELGMFGPWQAKADDATVRRVLLSAAIERYMEAVSGLAPSTLRSHRSCFKTFTERIDPHRRKRLDEITEDHVRRFIERPGQRATSQRKRLGELSAFFGWAIDEALLESNPATTHKTKGQRGVSVHDRQHRQGEPRAALMPDDFRYIKGALQLSPHEYLVDVMSFALATGIRAGELCALRRLDVHLDKPMGGMPYPVTGNIRIRSWNNPSTGEAFRTKTAKPRTVPLTPLAARIAAQHLAMYETDDGQQRLLRARRGGPLDPSELSRHFLKYRRAVGLTDRYTFHSTRHGCASWLMMLGCNLYSIKRLLGHKSLDKLDTYAELCEEFLLGNPRKIQREMIAILCPDLPAHIVDRVLPERRSLAALLSDERFGAVQSLHSIIPMEEVLFGGIGHERREPSRTTRKPISF